jgi:chromosome segregation ATPase
MNNDGELQMLKEDRDAWKAACYEYRVQVQATIDECDRLRAELAAANQRAEKAEAVCKIVDRELREACQTLIDYRDRVGPLGWQLEKADDYIRNIQYALDAWRKAKGDA